MYDAIVVGARCAGAPTAMLLARAGRRVLLLDKAQRGTDTLSTHYIHQPGIEKLDRWGLLERLKATGCPPIRDYTFDVGPFALTGSPPPIGDLDAAYSPRRYVLDRLLVEAAEEAGVEVRHGVTVDSLDIERGVVAGERASIVIGADGRNSTVARAAGAQLYNVRPTLTCAYYTYWTGVEMEGVELYPRPGRMIVASPTHDGRVVTIVFWPQSEFPAVRADIEGSFYDALALAPRLALRLATAQRAERFRGTRLLPNHYRQASGPGWALVGDAGYHKDPILALGISDAFRDAELLSQAIIEDDLDGYGHRRDELSAHGFESTVQFAHLQPPPMEMIEALRGDQPATDRFFGTFAGTVEPLSAAGR
jgi:2-polyprenyl-6-methoxyphenol hydroxylase-like FAD-dependent oxidoreductase